MAEFAILFAPVTDSPRNRLNQYLTRLLAQAEATLDVSSETDTRAELSALIDTLQNPPDIFRERSKAPEVLIALQASPTKRLRL